ncbi:unnamed protein product, partial [Medioppia subpectinata]
NKSDLKLHLNNSSTKVFKNPRILCLVTTQPKNHKTKALAVKETWGKACDILYFASSEADPELPAIAVECESYDHDHLLCKNIKAIRYGAHKFKGRFDWLFKADDDTFAVMDNLKYLVRESDPNDAVWFGCPFALGGNRTKLYMSGGAGYAISSEAINRLMNEFENPSKCMDWDLKRETGADDWEIGSCLNKLNVKIGEERDAVNKKRFFPFRPEELIYPKGDFYDWFKTYNGLDCCSNKTIAFHYVSAEDMYVYHFLIHHLIVKTSI